MKIGIFTFHSAHNYGAVLQAYALKEVLRSMRHIVDIIDYDPKCLTKTRCLMFEGNGGSEIIKGIFRSLFLSPVSVRRKRAFDKFIAHRLSPVSLDMAYRNSNYDAFVFGSDQIWNNRLLGDFDSVYFGDFAAARGVRLISYAASLGRATASDVELRYFKEKLKLFSGISVREKSLQEILKPCSSFPVEVVLDPTLLADPSLFNPILKKPVFMRRPYILIYHVTHVSKEMRKMAESVAEQLGATVIELSSVLTAKLMPLKNQGASPEEFIGFIKNAACVFTTSFHGTAFSIILERPFYTVIRGGDHDERSRSLLTLLGLETRLVSLGEDIKFASIDYAAPRKILDEQRLSSLNFLRSVLG